MAAAPQSLSPHFPGANPAETKAAVNPTDAPTSPRAGQERIRCRSLTVDGFQCSKPAMKGHDLCFYHDQNGKVSVSPDAPIAVPVLDNLSSIQLLLTRIADGLLSGKLNPQVGRTVSYTCQVAMSTLARPAAPRLKPTEQKPAAEEPVLEVSTGPDGQPLAPVRKYFGPEGEFKPSWSISKYFYEKECEELGRAIPACAEEYPASGWLTEEEMKEDPEDFKARNHLRLRKLRLRAGVATITDLEEELREARAAQVARDPFHLAQPGMDDADTGEAELHHSGMNLDAAAAAATAAEVQTSAARASQPAHRCRKQANRTSVRRFPASRIFPGRLSADRFFASRFLADRLSANRFLADRPSADRPSADRFLAGSNPHLRCPLLRIQDVDCRRGIPCHVGLPAS